MPRWLHTPPGCRRDASPAYTICEVDLHRHTVRLYWNQSDGTPYAYLSALPRDLEGRDRQAAVCHQRWHVQFQAQACGPVRAVGARTRARKHQVRQWQLSHEAERDLLYIGRQCGRCGDASISKAATSGRPSNAIRADAGWALAPSFQPGQYIPQNGAMVWAYVRIAKSYSPFLRKQCHLTASHAYSVTGGNALMRFFLTGAVFRAYTRRRLITPAMSCRLAPCWLYSKQIKPHLGNKQRCTRTRGLSTK